MAAARPAEQVVIPLSKTTSLKSLSFLVQMFRQPVPTKQFSQTTKPFSVFEQTSGNSHWLSSYQRNGAQRLGLKPETANADNQLHPGFRLCPGRPLDSWFFRRQPTGRGRLLLQ
jgi:hypothetical protein